MPRFCRMRRETREDLMPNYFEKYLIDHSEEINDYLVKYFQFDTHPEMRKYLYNPLAEYTANAGKRHRPLICLLACAVVGGNPKDAYTAAAAIEHFHTAALIHDDIADESTLRRGKPCMHITEGIGLAINAGDLALSLVNGAVLHDKDMDNDTKVRVLTELVDMTARTVEGQALDLGWARDGRYDITIEDYLTMATHKTAFYSGGVPLAIGAIIGRASEEQIELFRAFGMDTGLAFQIQDDLLNLIGTEESTKKDFRSDITEGKRTLPVVHALAHSKDAEELESILMSRSHDDAVKARAVQILQEAGSIEFAHEYSMQLTAKAKENLKKLDLDKEANDLFLAMADFFVERLV